MYDRLSVRGLDEKESEKIIEDLRFGIPPSGYIKMFTVGRESNLKELAQTLEASVTGKDNAWLVKASYGSGKSHMLKLIAEIAGKNQYVTSLVTVNSQEGVRFNRMDQILGAVTRCLVVPGQETLGIRSLFTVFENNLENGDTVTLEKIRQITKLDNWDDLNNNSLRSTAIRIALLVWIKIRKNKIKELDRMILEIESVLEDWLNYPENYRGRRKELYSQLIKQIDEDSSLENIFTESQREWRFYADDVFTFTANRYQQSWDALNDLNEIAKLSGYKGVILLFDEFEDVIHNLNRKDLQQQAFMNLFKFFNFQYIGKSYFAVTPEFERRCKAELNSRGVYTFEFSQFDELNTFQLEPIRHNDLIELAKNIRRTHGQAYNWDAEKQFDDKTLVEFVDELFKNKTPDMTRISITDIVRELDSEIPR